MKKKVKFRKIKQGQFFRWKRRLYQKSDISDSQKIQGKDAGAITYLDAEEKVTIVKVKILEN